MANDAAVVDQPTQTTEAPAAPSSEPSFVQQLKNATGRSLSDSEHSQDSSLSRPAPKPAAAAPAAPAAPITPKPATPESAPAGPVRGPDGKFVSASDQTAGTKDGAATVEGASSSQPPAGPTSVPALALADLTDDELSAFAEAEGLDLNSPEDRAFVGRLFLRELSRLTAAPDAGVAANDAVLTEFERALAAKISPTAAPPTPPAPPAPSAAHTPPPAGGPVASPQPTPGPAPGPTPFAQATYEQLSQQVNDGFAWKSPIDAIKDTMSEYARISAEADMHAQAGRPYTPDFTRINAIEEAKHMRAFAQQLPAIGAVVKQLFDSAIEQRFGQEFSTRMQPILPAVQHFQQQQVAGSVNAAIDDLAASDDYSQIREYFKPTPGSTSNLKFTDPETGQVTEFADNPINRVFVQHPEIFDIEVAADPARGISELDALRLTATKRYRMAMNFLNAQRLPSNSARQLVAQGLKAGKAQSTRQVLEQARQRMNGQQPGSPASSRGGGSNGNGNGNGDSAVKQMIDSGGMTQGRSFGSLFK